MSINTKPRPPHVFQPGWPGNRHRCRVKGCGLVARNAVHDTILAQRIQLEMAQHRAEVGEDIGPLHFVISNAHARWFPRTTVLSDPNARVEDPEWVRFDSDDPTDVARWLTDGQP